MKKELTIDDFLLKLGRRKRRPFKPSVTIFKRENRICLMLEDVSFYSEWIKGEASDVGIYRAVDDGRFVGGFFPLNESRDFTIYGRYST